MVPYVLAVAQFLVVNFLLAAPASVSGPLTRELGLQSESLGILGSAFFYAYAAMQVPVGAMVDSQGVRRPLLISLVLMGFGTSLLAFASSYPTALAGRAISGLGGGMVAVPLLGIISRWFPAERFATMWGVAIGAGYGVGTLLATAPLAVAAARWGWRAPFIVTTAICAILFPLVLLSIHEPNSSSKSSHLKARPRFADRFSRLAIRLRSGFVFWIGNRTLWGFSLVLFLAAGSFMSFQALWAGPYARSALGLRDAALGRFLALIPAGLIVGFVAAGIASDWMQTRKRVVVAGCLGYWLLWMGQAASVTGVTAWSPFVAVTLMGALLGLLMVGYGLIPLVAPSEIEGVVTGVVNTSGFLGSAAFQVITGFVVRPDSPSAGQNAGHGFFFTFSLLAVATLAASGAAAVIREPTAASPAKVGASSREADSM